MSIPQIALSLLGKYWHFAAIALVIAGLGFTLWAKNVQIDSLSNQIDKAKINIERMVAERKDLIASIEEQNSVISKLNEDKELLKGRLEQVEVSNQRERHKTDEMIRNLRKKEIPNECVPAAEHLNEFMQDFADDWNSGK